MRPVWGIGVTAGVLLSETTSGTWVGAGVKLGTGFSFPELEESKVCLFVIKVTWDTGLRRLMVQGDCPPLTKKLKHHHQPRSSLGMIMNDILSLAQRFDFISWNHVLQVGNWVVHSLTRLQPYDST